jgi:hypothetical protein
MFGVQVDGKQDESGRIIAPSALSDFFTALDGSIPDARWRRYWKILRLLDAASDARTAVGRRRSREAARDVPAQAVLLTAVEVPGREADLQRVIERITGKTHHYVTTSITDMKPVGKFDNINRAISDYDLTKYDWMLVVDDDISLPDDFLDLLLYFSYVCNLKLAQPAHRFLSYSTYAITERHWGSQARRTGYVEIGPVSLLHKDTFADLIPFPSLRWSWGLDILWSHLARRQGWKMGVIDAVPIRHLRPVGGSYDWVAARDEAIEFLRAHGITLSRAEIFGINQRIA